MFFRHYLSCLLVWGMLFGVTEAHTVPTLVVEVEFTAQRTATMKVNLDPRLFLTAEPTSLPPVPASWWFDQDEKAQTESRAKASKYVRRLLAFKVGDTLIPSTWKVIPIDSASAFPLATSSAEVHLLAESTGPLPDAEGPFTLTVGKDCPVGLILVNSLEGLEERKPQSLFAGETSVGFPLPALIQTKAKAPPYVWLAILVIPLLLLTLRRLKR